MGTYDGMQTILIGTGVVSGCTAAAIALGKVTDLGIGALYQTLSNWFNNLDADHGDVPKQQVNNVIRGSNDLLNDALRDQTANTAANATDSFINERAQASDNLMVEQIQRNDPRESKSNSGPLESFDSKENRPEVKGGNDFDESPD